VYTNSQPLTSYNVNFNPKQADLKAMLKKKHHFSVMSRSLPDETSKLADDPEVTKREMRVIQRGSRKVRRLEGTGSVDDVE